MSLGISEVQAEYTFSLGTTSIAPEIGIGATFSNTTETMLSAGAKFYPFKENGKGFFLNLLGTCFWGTNNAVDLRLDIGYRWIFLKHVTATVEAGGVYIPNAIQDSFGPSVLISLGGCF